MTPSVIKVVKLEKSTSMKNTKTKDTQKERNTPKVKKKLDAPKHLSGFQSFVISKHAEIVTACLFTSDMKKKKPTKIVLNSEDELEILEYSGNLRPWVSEYKDLGLKLKKLLLDKDPHIAFEVIQKYPDIIFDDGLKIQLALLLTLSSDARRNLKKKVSKGINRTKKAIHYLSPDGPTTRYVDEETYEERVLNLKTGFFNPLQRILFFWSTLTSIGNAEERKMARGYLEELGLKFLIEKKSGRPLATIRSDKIDKIKPTPFTDLRSSLDERFKVYKQLVNETYKTTLKDLQELFRNQKFNKRQALMQYIETRKLVPKLRSYFAKHTESFGKTRPSKSIRKISFKEDIDVTPETLKNKVVDEQLRYKSPSDISWYITASILEASPKTLKQYYDKDIKLPDSL